MCIICIDLVRGKIRYKDALRNMSENIENIDDKHAKRILKLAALRKEEEELLEEELKEESRSDEEEETFFSST